MRRVGRARPRSSPRDVSGWYRASCRVGDLMVDTNARRQVDPGRRASIGLTSTEKFKPAGEWLITREPRTVVAAAAAEILEASSEGLPPRRAAEPARC